MLFRVLQDVALPRVRSVSSAAALTLLAAAAVAPFGCTAGKPKPDFDSPDPYARALAIEEAAIRRDRAAIPDLIEALESDDPAVRFAAIGALERITGQTHGYRSYDPEWERQAAIERWVAAFGSGDGHIAPGRDGSGGNSAEGAEDTRDMKGVEDRRVEGSGADGVSKP